MPSLPNVGGDEGEVDIELMPMVRRVMIYNNCDFEKALEMPTDRFLQSNKNYIVDELSTTQEGRDYLDKCKRLNTTSIDIKAFRKKKKG